MPLPARNTDARHRRRWAMTGALRHLVGRNHCGARSRHRSTRPFPDEQRNTPGDKPGVLRAGGSSAGDRGGGRALRPGQACRPTQSRWCRITDTRALLVSRSLELRTLLPALIGGYKPARYEPAPPGQIVIVAAFRSSTASMGFGYIDADAPRKPNTVRRHPLAATGIGRYVSQSDVTGGGPCSGGK